MVALNLIVHHDASVFEMTNPQSMMWVTEILGYFFMGLTTLFTAPVFGAGRIEKLIKWLFVANGVLGILTPIGYGLNFPLQVLLWGTHTLGHHNAPFHWSNRLLI